MFTRVEASGRVMIGVALYSGFSYHIVCMTVINDRLMQFSSCDPNPAVIEASTRICFSYNTEGTKQLSDLVNITDAI